jgi:hypothetical protein
VNKTLELEAFRYFWQQHEANSQGAAQGLLPQPDQLDPNFGRLIASLDTRIQDKIKQLEHARLAQERLYND